VTARPPGHGRPVTAGMNVGLLWT